MVARSKSAGSVLLCGGWSSTLTLMPLLSQSSKLTTTNLATVNPMQLIVFAFYSFTIRRPETKKTLTPVPFLVAFLLLILRHQSTPTPTSSSSPLSIPIINQRSCGLPHLLLPLIIHRSFSPWVFQHRSPLPLQQPPPIPGSPPPLLASRSF